MKKTVIILTVTFFLIAPPYLFSQGSWIELSSPTNVLLNKCTFTDSLNGWAIGDSGVIIHTSNGGNNWIIQSNNHDHFLRDISFINKNTGWVTSWFADFSPGTLFYKTTNGGINWVTSLYPDTSFFIESIYFNNAMTGYFGTAFPGGRIFYTTNGGTSWLSSIVDSSTFSSYPIREMRFYNSNIGFALGGYFDLAGVIWRTTDGGVNWNAQVVGPEPVGSILFKDSLTYLAVGGDYEYGPSVSLTSNSGMNWHYETLNEFGIAYSIAERTPSQYWIALGFAGKFLYSSDAGEDWEPIATPNNTNIYSICFTDEKHGWGVGDNGVIVKFDPNSIGISSAGNLVPEHFRLYQNYPNPFNPSTNIIFELAAASDLVELSVFDILGKEIFKDEMLNLQAGQYRFIFDGTGLNSGVYFYRLSGNGFMETKKMVLMK